MCSRSGAFMRCWRARWLRSVPAASPDANPWRSGDLATQRDVPRRPAQLPALSNRDLPRFADRNNIPARDIRRSRLLRALLATGDRSLWSGMLRGVCHFNGSLTNAREVKLALAKLAHSGHARLVQRESSLVLALYEQLFDHESFTGRSGTFFAYEGLGSIYWHMVSKLLLAVQETYFRAVTQGHPSPSYGASPTSTTTFAPDRRPQDTGGVRRVSGRSLLAHAGAHGSSPARPDGQVKEDILCRRGELGPHCP